MSFRVPEKYRIRSGALASDESFGCNAAFFVPNVLERKISAPPLKIIASDGAGWEHVSVSLPHRCPTWPEMSMVKAIFWEPEDCVIQFHPPESEYVNNHPFCLHLWRPTDHDIPTPPSILVGVLPGAGA